MTLTIMTAQRTTRKMNHWQPSNRNAPLPSRKEPKNNEQNQQNRVRDQRAMSCLDHVLRVMIRVITVIILTANDVSQRANALRLYPPQDPQIMVRHPQAIRQSLRIILRRSQAIHRQRRLRSHLSQVLRHSHCLLLYYSRQYHHRHRLHQDQTNYESYRLIEQQVFWILCVLLKRQKILVKRIIQFIYYLE